MERIVSSDHEPCDMYIHSILKISTVNVQVVQTIQYPALHNQDKILASGRTHMSTTVMLLQEHNS